MDLRKKLLILGTLIVIGYLSIGIMIVLPKHWKHPNTSPAQAEVHRKRTESRLPATLESTETAITQSTPSRR